MTHHTAHLGWLGRSLLAITLLASTWSAHAALQARDHNLDAVIDGYYDTVLDLTWWADANAAAGSSQDDGFITNDGYMSWQNASTWVANFKPFGIGGWRLPSIDVSSSCNGYGCTSTASELGHMYHGNLGGTPNSGVGGAPFTGLVPGQYWAGQLNLLDLDQAVTFDFSDGYQDADFKTEPVGAVWAVARGDVLAVPEPSSVVLSSVGMLALLGLARARRR